MFYKKIKIQFGYSIEVFKFDNGFEYCSSLVIEFCSSCGIIHNILCVIASQQNMVVEKK